MEPSQVIDYEPMNTQSDLFYEEKPVAILETREKVLQKKIVRVVKVLCEHYNQMEVTWEMEDKVKERYPHLFEWGMWQIWRTKFPKRGSMYIPESL